MKSKKLLSTVLALTMISTTLLVGCGKEDKPVVKPKEDVATAKKDAVQELTFSGGPGAAINPGVTETNTEWAPEGYCYEGIVRNGKNEDGSEEAKPGVAKTWDVSEDGLTYTFDLRDDAKWADGKAVTAEDFVYSWQRLVDPTSDCVRNGALLNGVVKNAQKVNEGKGKVDLNELGVKADGNKFIVTLEKPCLYFLQYCFHPNLKPVRKDFVDKFGVKMGTTAESVMGNGAYKCTFLKEKEGMVFEKNDNYWNKDTRFITKVTFKYMLEENTVFAAFNQKQIDRAGFSNPDFVEQLQSNKDVVYVSAPGANIDFIGFNNKNEYLSNTKIRQAISAAISREDYVDAVANGVGFPAYNMVPPVLSCGTKKYTPGDFKAEINKIDPKPTFQAGLKELGKSEDLSKVTLRMIGRGTNSYVKNQLEFFQQELQSKLGIKIKLELVDYKIMYKQVQAGDYDMNLGGWFADWNDPSNFLDTFITGDYYARDTKYSNADYDAQMKKAHEAKSLDEAYDFYAAAERILCIDDPAMAPFVFSKDQSYSWNYVKNYEQRVLTFGFEDYEGAYISGRPA